MKGSGIERRTAIGGLGFAALLPLAGLGAEFGPARAASRNISPPAGAFRLERALRRELVGGAAIEVTRHWRISFAADASGLTVLGEQIFCEVAAPEALAPLAAIERARSASRVFPLALDGAGLIRGGRNDGSAAELSRALDTGRALLRALPASPTRAEEAKRFMAQLAAMGAEAVSRLPRDLFFPTPGEAATTREIALPGGAKGAILVTARASAAPDSGLLAASERLIVTRLPDGDRRAEERWSLTAI